MPLSAHRATEAANPTTVGVVIAMTVIIAVGVVAWAVAVGQDRPDERANEPVKRPIISEPRLAAVNEWGIAVKSVGLAEIADSAFDLVVVDYSIDGTEAGAFSRDDVAMLRQSTDGKLAVALLPIGEAEDFRFYWQMQSGMIDAENWTANPPQWLGHENPRRAGQFRVRFWHREWQSIIIHNPGNHPIIGNKKSFLDRIIDAGFDGVLLDHIDAVAAWKGDDGVTERVPVSVEMARFIVAVAAHARTRNPHFIIGQRNGDRLFSSEQALPAELKSAWMTAVQWISADDVFYRGAADVNNPLAPATARLASLDAFRAAGKLVTVVDYFDDGQAGYNPADVDDFFARARQRGFVPTVGPRELNRILIPPGHFPD